MSQVNPLPCIAIWGTRRRGHEFIQDCPPRQERTIIQALERMLHAELGFGGSIVNIREDGDLITITTRTVVFSCEDHTHFQGSAEDMRPLLEACHFFLMASEQDSAIFEEVSEQLANGPAGGNAFLVANMTPALIGSGRVRTSILLACGIREEADLERGRRINTADLVPTIELWMESSGDTPFREFANNLFAA